MEKYNYQEAVENDVKSYIYNNYTTEEITDKLSDSESWYNELNDELFVNDSVTGNASGSYTFCAWDAEENLCHNWDLLSEALQEFGCDTSYIKKGAEACDVTIRCYLLGSVISEVLDELAEDPQYQTPDDETEDNEE